MENLESIKQLCDEEGDFRFWIDGDYVCVVYRMGKYGQLNGYVGIKKDHIYYGKTYDDISVDVHGGLTYDGEYLSCYKDNDRWWLGFDTAHSADFVPRFGSDGFNSNGIYRTMGYVINELNSLAKQLKEVA